MRSIPCKFVLGTFLSSLLCLPAHADDQSLKDALLNGKVNADMRLRFEHSEQDSQPKNSNAPTSRLRLGYKTGSFHDFSAMGELEVIQGINHDNYNDGVEGPTNRPRVNDPDAFGFNQLYISYAGIEDTVVSVGRMRQSFDNKRWIGNSSFRMNERTYSGATVQNKSFDKLTLDYSYFTRAHQPSGNHSVQDELGGDINLLHATYAYNPQANVSAYGYLLGLERNDAALASQTYGVRFWGEYPLENAGLKLLYVAEVANQSDYRDNPNSYSEMYYRIEPGVSFGNTTWKLGYEELGGNGTSAIQTPFANAHSMSGLSDAIGSTPANGLRDFYLDASYKPDFAPWVKGTNVGVQLHDFSAQNIDQNYGQEWSVDLSYAIDKNWTVGVQHADYTAQNYVSDTQRSWVYVNYVY